MRQVLVEAARRRTAGKRGGGAAAMVTFDEGLDAAGAQADDVIALHDALDALAVEQPRLAQMVECRFFGGLSAAETAEALGISEATVQRDWRAARAWLAWEIHRA
jgi:RNA polymerase sigma factor (TIGR02999 family)